MKCKTTEDVFISFNFARLVRQLYNLLNAINSVALDYYCLSRLKSKLNGIYGYWLRNLRLSKINMRILKTLREVDNG